MSDLGSSNHHMKDTSIHSPSLGSRKPQVAFMAASRVCGLVQGYFLQTGVHQVFSSWDYSPLQGLAHQPGDKLISRLRTRMGIRHQPPHALFCLEKREKEQERESEK